MKKRLPSLVPVLAAFAAVFAPGAHAQHRMRIAFPGYNSGGEVLANFPALVVFTNNVGGTGFSFQHTQFLRADAYDLRFYNESGAPLDYEIDTLDADRLLAWVKVPQLKPDGTSFIRAAWGDPAHNYQLPCTTNGAVWSDGFSFVQHYSSNINNTVSLADATPGRRVTAIVEASNVPAAGKIGSAMNFTQGNNSRLLSTPDTAPNQIPTGAEWTVSVWFKGLTSINNSFRTLARSPTPPHVLVT